MKDLEKIKSEDLAAQVQDANPANFAIEQEVAQLVGATVPQPTQPSADDARELPAQLLVFLRRALLPIRSALRTALAAIYAHLDSRCTDYTPAGYASYIPRPYDPMGTPPTPRSVANLLTALTAFSARKISNGSAPNDGIKDGTSLAHLLCSTDAANAVLEIKDDNYGWEASKSNWLGTLLGLFPNAKRIDVKCETITNSPVTTSYSNNETDIHIYAKTLSFTQANSYNYLPKCNVYLEEMETFSDSSNNIPVFQSKGIYFMKYKAGVWRVAGSAGWGNSQTQKIYCGCKGSKTDLLRFWAYDYDQDQAPNLVDFEIAEGTCQSLTLQGLFHLTAENMYNHILCRLKQDEAGCGDGVTITLGSTNIAKLEAVEEYNTKLTELEDTYGYTFA